MKLTTENLDTAIKALELQSIGSDCPFLMLPTAEKKLSKRYSGKGRPKKKDYDYVEYDWYKSIKEVI